MKRTIPLLITASVGFVLIVAFFIPQTESWGEVAAIWFDVLASIAFILGGGNLLKVHLKKISDGAAGWAYSVVTLLAFTATLGFGLLKWGSPPAFQLEFYGESFAPLPIAEFPLTFQVDGALPAKHDRDRVPTSCQRQFEVRDGLLRFRGWMTADQQKSLAGMAGDEPWRAAVARLYEEAQPPPALRGKVRYLAGRQVLSLAGSMRPDDRRQLESLGAGVAWRSAIRQLDEASNRLSEVQLSGIPAGLDAAAVSAIGANVQLDVPRKILRIRGPMSIAERDALERQFPLAMPLSDRHQQTLLAELAARGPLTERQREIVRHRLAAGWTEAQLRQVLDEAGQAAPESHADPPRAGPAVEAATTTPAGGARGLNADQRRQLHQFVQAADGSPARIRQWTAALAAARPWTGQQQQALRAFFARLPSAGQRRKELAVALIQAGPVSADQRRWLLADYRDEMAWKHEVGQLLRAAHVVKYPWSGEYRAEGAPFWWLYEYAFKPLTATMFAMLAFYVASAAFRAFRAKNLDATLLLGTAFIVLLGRTFAGVLATSWLPESLSMFRFENLTITIMSVFNTAGNRAIMIGIALGIASLSLKVLLGVDRSYLGASED